MKKINKIVVLLLISGKIFSQLVTTSPTTDLQLAKLNVNMGEQTNIQMQGLAKYVEQIQKARQSIHVVTEGLKQAKQTADIMTAIMNENYSIDVFSDLKLNKNFKSVLENVLCINFNDYTPNNSSLLKIQVGFMSAIGKCNNLGYYSSTYSGVDYKSKGNLYGSFKGRSSYGNYISQLKQLNKDVVVAKNYEEHAVLINNRTKLEVGYKMLAVADEMIKSAEELQKVLNVGKSTSEEVSISDYQKAEEKTNNSMALLDKLSSLVGMGSGIKNTINGKEDNQDLANNYQSNFSKNNVSNSDSKGVDMTRAQRIELVLKSHDYLQKGLEYKQRAIELIEECASSNASKLAVKKQKRKLEYLQLKDKLYARQ